MLDYHRRAASTPTDEPGLTELDVSSQALIVELDAIVGEGRWAGDRNCHGSAC